MHKCQCGQEFEGNFCPNCGLKWQEEKTCPKCGATIAGNARYCNECGYPINPKYSIWDKWRINFKIFYGLHKKAFYAILIISIAVIVALACTIPMLLSTGIDGTYYKLKSNGETDKATYFIIKSGKWEDEDGESGTYKLDGDKITFFVTFFGETEELCDGTIADGKLTINGVMSGKEEYVTEDYKGETKSIDSKTLYNFNYNYNNYINAIR